VFDHFHVIKLFNDVLSDLRRSHYDQADEALEEILKGSRWLLLKSPENLDSERDEGTRLEKALRLNAPMATA
jgi:transposase